MADSSTHCARASAQTPLFETFPDIWRRLVPSIRNKTGAHDEVLVHHGDPAHSLWLVTRGWVKLTRQTPDGEETVVGLCTAGEMFGEAALFENGTYPYHAEVIGENAEFGIIPARDVQEAIRRDAAFSSAVMAMLNERITQAELRLEHTSTMSAPQRLGCFLLRLSKPGAANQKIIQIPIEKHILASYLGIKPETLSRSQQQLKAMGVDILGSHVDIRDVGALREFVCGSCSKPPGNCSGCA